jgi:hypothetical protein
MGINKNRRPRFSLPVYTRRKKRRLKPYTVNAAPVVTRPLAGMDLWLSRCIRHSDNSLWNNGSWVLRQVRGKPGVVSNHSKGVAVDLSYRWQSEKNRGRQDGRRVSLAYMNKLLQNADTLGIQLVIDYALNRSWKCSRGTWIAGTFESGDWYHIEVDPVICNSPELAKQAWDKVFGVIPAVFKNPV